MFKYFLVIIFVSFFSFLHADFVYIPDLGVRIVGSSWAHVTGPTFYCRYHQLVVNPDGSGNWAYCQSCIWNTATFSWGSVVYDIPYTMHSYPNCTPDIPLAKVYINGCDTDDPQSYPEGYDLVVENRFISNPFDFPIYVKVWFEDNLFDEVTIQPNSSHAFELETFTNGDDFFGFQISSNGNLYQPSPASSWDDLIKYMTRIFQDDVWGDIPDYGDLYSLPAVTNINEGDIINIDVVDEFQLALQRQDLSSQSLQLSFENALNKNKENDRQSIIDGIVFSGIPSELQNIASKFDNNFKIDDNALISAINNLNLSSSVTIDNDFSELISAIENLNILSTNYISLSSTNIISLSLTNNINFPTNLFVEYDGFYFNITNDLIDFSEFDSVFETLPDLTNTFSFFNQDKQNIINHISSGWLPVPMFNLNMQKQNLLLIPIGLIDNASISFDLNISPVFLIIRMMFFLAMSYAFFVRDVKVILWGLN